MGENVVINRDKVVPDGGGIEVVTLLYLIVGFDMFTHK